MAISGITDTTSLTNLVNSNLSEDLKLKGASKIGQIISDQGNKISTLMLPLALNFAKELGIDPNTLLVPDVCPSVNTLNSILPTLNNLIDDLNQTGVLITDLNKVVGSIAIGGQILQTTSETLNTLIPVLNTAIAAIPPPGLPGAIVSSVNVINKANEKILFKNDGSPQLPPINSAISSAALKFIVASSSILALTNILQSIVTLLKQCFPDVNINSVDSSVLALAESAKPKDQENSLQGYKGFNLEIINVPFNDTLTQRKAVAKNQSGEIVLQTELSFTTDNSTLITELKNIIDQSGLTGNITQNSLTSTVPPSILSNNIDPKTVQADLLQSRIKNTTDQFIKQYNSFSRDLSLPENYANYELPINLKNYSYNLEQFNIFKTAVTNITLSNQTFFSTEEVDNYLKPLQSTFDNLTYLISLTKQ
jgi:hypothetical protein